MSKNVVLWSSLLWLWPLSDISSHKPHDGWNENRDLAVPASPWLRRDPGGSFPGLLSRSCPSEIPEVPMRPPASMMWPGWCSARLVGTALVAPLARAG